MNTFSNTFFVSDPNELSNPPTELEKSPLLLEGHRPLSTPGKIPGLNEVGESLREVTIRCLRAAPKVIALEARAQALHRGPADVAVKDVVNERVDAAVGKG